MKKSISITLCAALLALSGCSQNTNSDVLSSDISSAASESQSTASQEENSGSSLQNGNGGFKVEGTKLLDANGKVDVEKVQPITFDPFNNTYVALGKIVGTAFSDGKELK